MYEHICDKIIPGATYRDTGDTPEAVPEKAVAHLNEHHNMDNIDNPRMPDVSVAVIKLQA